MTLCSLRKTATSSIRATVTLIVLHHGGNNTTLNKSGRIIDI